MGGVRATVDRRGKIPIIWDCHSEASTVSKDAIRGKRVHSSARGTAWQTRYGGLFFEPIQRPQSDTAHVEITLRIARSDYKLLEALYDDVASYSARLITSHVQGLIASAKHNARSKKNGTK